MRERILVCDHRRHGAALLRVHLERLGWEVIVAHSGAEAMVKILEVHPQKIILESGMPDISGHEITRIIRSNPGTDQSFVLLMIDEEDPELLSRSYQAGADMVVTKPFDVSQIKLFNPSSTA
jgi:DNA-binding response OmpR family regulator